MNVGRLAGINQMENVVSHGQRTADVTKSQPKFKEEKETQKCSEIQIFENQFIKLTPAANQLATS